jgi:hypothetical protein
MGARGSTASQRSCARSSQRTVERDDDDGALFATSDPARVICRLETGACTADDDAARVRLSDHPELEARLQSHMDHLRQRAWRAVAQRDRETAARRVLANAEPGLMVPFQDLRPLPPIPRREGAVFWHELREGGLVARARAAPLPT